MFLLKFIFSPYQHEIVQDYVQLKQLKTWFVNDYPGYNRTVSFLKWHRVWKKGGQVKLARKNVNSDPFENLPLSSSS